MIRLPCALAITLTILGGFLFCYSKTMQILVICPSPRCLRSVKVLTSRIPNPSSSFSMTALSPNGLSTSKTIKSMLHDLATVNGKMIMNHSAFLSDSNLKFDDSEPTCNDLTTSTPTVFGSLDDTRQVKDLNWSAVHIDCTRDTV